MAILNILEFPDPRLRTVAKPVTEVNDEIRRLCDDLLETMYAAPGIGLAATQCNVHKRVLVCDVSEDNSEPLALINPQIEILDETPQNFDEGCLSVPGFFETVQRPARIRVTALNREGEPISFEPEGLLSVCIQHEVDHLDGKLFVDYISPIKRQRIRKKLEKQSKVNA